MAKWILKEAFPVLYSISRAREFFVSKVMCFSNGRLHWDIRFRRPPQDWESESFDRFWVVLYSMNEWGVGDDNICWKPAMRRGFEVRGSYHSLSLSSVTDFPWKMVWQSKVPPRVAFFSWTTALGKILTTNNLWKRHIAVLWCFMCKKVWGISGSSASSLSYSIWLVVYGFLFVWYTLGHVV